MEQEIKVVTLSADFERIIRDSVVGEGPGNVGGLEPGLAQVRPAPEARGPLVVGEIELVGVRLVDLRGAVGVPGTLIATQFVGEDRSDAADLTGLDWSEADTHGLPEDQRAFLASHARGS